MKYLLAAALLVLSFGASAQQAIIGIGVAQSCGDWTKERSMPRDPKGNPPWSEMVLISWIQGYASGLNVATSKSQTKDMVDFVSFNAVTSWLDTHCKANPFEGLYMSTLIMFGELRKAQGK